MEKTKKNFGSKDSENNLTSTKSPKYTQLNAKATKKSNISRIVTDDAVDSNRLNPIQLRVKNINGSNAGKSGSAASLNRKQTSHIPGRIVANSKPTGTAVGDLNCTWESPLHVSTPAADGNGRDCGGNDKDVIVMTTPKTQNSKDRTSKVKLFHMSESEEIVSTARGSKNSRASKKFSNMKSTQHSSEIVRERVNQNLCSSQPNPVEDDRLSLSAWGLPQTVLDKYRHHGITSLFEWQADCLCSGNVLELLTGIRGINRLLIELFAFDHFFVDQRGINKAFQLICFQKDVINLRYPQYEAGCHGETWFTRHPPVQARRSMVAELLILKSVLETRKKALFILPFVSVAREKASYLQGLFQEAGVRVDGYYGHSSPAGGFSSVDIAICTIEKANNLVNHLLEEGKIDQLGAVVVDELHMVGDSHRGYLLELLITKLRYVVSRMAAQAKPESIGSIATTSNPVQIIGMSATLPNLDILARWLDADLFKTEFRPVPLTEMVKIGSDIYDSNLTKLRSLNLGQTFKNDEDHIIPLCLETIKDGCSVLIFCPTKNWCEKLADSIAREFYSLKNEPPKVKAQGFVKASSLACLRLDETALHNVVEQLRRSPAGLDNMLSRMVPCGVGFHHAGLTFDKRDIVEGAFRQGALKVLVATSTLSSGVNLPARRVIIRTPMFHGAVIDTLSYKQMVGRAGRKGVDTQGESVLVCKPNERTTVKGLLESGLPPVSSCLVYDAKEGLNSSLKRAILEIVVSKVASTPEEVDTYARCTLLAASMERENKTAVGDMDAISLCIRFLKENEFIVLRKVTNPDNTETEVFSPTQLGGAVVASGLSPDEGLKVFTELQKARKCFVLENEIHTVYLVTPFYMQDQFGLDWYLYLCMWERMPQDMKRVAELIGVNERFLARAVQGRIPCETAQQVRAISVHKRFYMTLVLNDLINEMSLSTAAKKYGCNRGIIQSLQQSASTFAGMVTVFCNRLGWINLEMLLSQFQSRLSFGVLHELVDLVRISLLNGQRARVVYNGGYQTVAMLASADVTAVELLLRAASPFLSKKKADDENDWELEERMKSRCIWVAGQKGLTEFEAASMIVDEAKKLLADDLLKMGVEWQPPEDPEKHKVNKSRRQSIGFGPRKQNRHRRGSKSGLASQKDIDGSSVTILTPPISMSRSQKFLNLGSQNFANSAVPQTNVDNGVREMLGDVDASNLKLIGVVDFDDNVTMGEVSQVNAEMNTLNVNIENNSDPPKSENNDETVSKNLLLPYPVDQSDDKAISNENGETDSREILRNVPETLDVDCVDNLQADMNDGTCNVSGQQLFGGSFEISETSLMLDTQTMKMIVEPVHNMTAAVERQIVRENLEPMEIKMVGNTHKDNEYGISHAVGHDDGAYEEKNNISPPIEHNLSKQYCEVSFRMPSSSKCTNVKNRTMKQSVRKEHVVSEICRNPETEDADISIFDGSLELLPASAFERRQFCPVDFNDRVTFSEEMIFEDEVNPLSHVSLKRGTDDNLSSMSVSDEDVDFNNSSVFMEYSLNRAINFESEDKETCSDNENLFTSFLDVPDNFVITNAKAVPVFERNTKSGSDQADLPHIATNLCQQQISESHKSDALKDSNAVTEHQNRTSVSGKSVESNPATTDDISSVEENLDEFFCTVPCELQGIQGTVKKWNDMIGNTSAYLTSSITSSFMMKIMENDDFADISCRNVKQFHSGMTQLSRQGGDELPRQTSPKIKKFDSGCMTSSLSPEIESVLNVFCDDFEIGKSKKAPKRTTSKSIRGEEKSSGDKKRRKTGAESPVELVEDGFSSNSDSSMCVPPTPPSSDKNNVSKPNAAGTTPKRLLGGVVRTPGTADKRRKPTQARRNLLDRCNEQKTISNNCEIKKNEDMAVGLLLTPGENQPQNRTLNDGNVSGVLFTGDAFTIYDVSSDKHLFEVFIKEWSEQKYFAMALACEKLAPENEARDAAIGGKFQKGKKKQTPGKESSIDLNVEDLGLSVVGLAVCWENQDVYYVALTRDRVNFNLDHSLAAPPVCQTLSVEDRLASVKSVLSGDFPDGVEPDSRRIVMFDMKAQYKIFSTCCGTVVRGRFSDPKVACWLIDPGAKEKNLHSMVTSISSSKSHLLEMVGCGAGLSSLGLTLVDTSSGRVRACVESVLVHQLMTDLGRKLAELGLDSSFNDVEMPSLEILAKMELNGMGFDQIECDVQKSIMQAKLSAIEDLAYQLAGHPFSLTSIDDISQVLFVELRLPPSGESGPVKTLGTTHRAAGRGGRKPLFSTSKDVLEKLKKLHPLPGLLLEWRRISSALTKVVFPLQKKKVFNPVVDMFRIYGVSDMFTATGRVTMSEPNLQNIPKDFEIEMPDMIGESPPPVNPIMVPQKSVKGKRGQGPLKQMSKCLDVSAALTFSVSMRHSFVLFQGGILLAADYSQLELRVIAHLSRDRKLTEVLNRGGDVFRSIAAHLKMVEEENVTPEQRQQAKQICYGMIYGIGPKALGEQLGVDDREASVFIETFKSKYTGMRSFLHETVQTCRKEGYVKTMSGRRRYLPAIKDPNIHARAHAERQAVNTTVQGSGADLVKMAMIRIDKELSTLFPETITSHRHRRDLSKDPRKATDQRGAYSVPRGGYFILQLHDELIYEVNEADLMTVANVIKCNMENVMTVRQTASQIEGRPFVGQNAGP